jgi:hypothetical protein
MSRDASKTPDAFPAHRATTLTLPRINRAVGTTLAVEKEATAQRVGDELEACSAGFSTGRARDTPEVRIPSPAKSARAPPHGTPTEFAAYARARCSPSPIQVNSMGRAGEPNAKRFTPARPMLTLRQSERVG